MSRRMTILFLFLGTLLGAADLARGVDIVRVIDGKSLNGSITSVSAEGVTLKSPAGETEPISVNRIDSIVWEEEPASFREIRSALRTGKTATAESRLTKAARETIRRPEVQTELDFNLALCHSLQAVAGEGTAELHEETLKEWHRFSEQHPDSYHVWDAAELEGNVLLVSAHPEEALPLYQKIASAPWPEFKRRGGILLGRAYLVLKDAEKAKQQFENAAVLFGNDKASQPGRAAAQIGLAETLSLSGGHDAATREIVTLIRDLPEAQRELHARAYCALGRCYERGDQKKPALLAFLHVTLLFPEFGEHHAEALGHLQTLWIDVYQKNTEASQTAKRLRELFPNNRWAQIQGSSSPAGLAE